MDIALPSWDVASPCTGPLQTHSWKPVTSCARQVLGLGLASSNPPVQQTVVYAAPAALVVDHRLRATSTAEAQNAYETAASLGLRPVLLSAAWPDGRPAKGQLMSAARDMRYSLMAEECARQHIPSLLIGYHAGGHVRLQKHGGCGHKGMLVSMLGVKADPLSMLLQMTRSKPFSCGCQGALALVGYSAQS